MGGLPGIDISGFSQGIPAAFNPFVARSCGFIIAGDHRLKGSIEINFLGLWKNYLELSRTQPPQAAYSQNLRKQLYAW